MPAFLKALSTDERKVLHALSSLAQPTRLSVIEVTGLSKGRVMEALRALRASGALSPTEETPQGQGRPAVIHRVAADAYYGVGAAMEVGSCTIAAVSGTGEVAESRHLATKGSAVDSRDLRAILREVREEIGAMIRRRGPERCVAAGLSVIGRVDTERGEWLSGLVYGPFHAIDAGAVLDGLGVATLVEDHARSLAFAELRRAGARREASFVLLYMAEGLGSALVLGGRIHRGCRGVAGEIGHIRLDNNERRCICGDVGCLETVASGSAVVASVRARVAEGVTSILKPKAQAAGRLTLRDVAEAALAGDRLARQVLDEAGSALGEACVVMMKIVNVPRIVVSGKAVVLRDHLREPMERRIREGAPAESRLESPVEFIDWSEEEEARGVALLAMDKALSAGQGPARNARRA
jgi:predicted NBD/HSP70 family sugar kinase